MLHTGPGCGLHVCSNLVLATQVVPAPVAVVIQAAATAPAEGVASGLGLQGKRRRMGRVKKVLE